MLTFSHNYCIEIVSRFIILYYMYYIYKTCASLIRHIQLRFFVLSFGVTAVFFFHLLINHCRNVFYLNNKTKQAAIELRSMHQYGVKYVFFFHLNNTRNEQDQQSKVHIISMNLNQRCWTFTLSECESINDNYLSSIDFGLNLLLWEMNNWLAFYSTVFFFIACIGFDTKQLIRSKSSTGNDFLPYMSLHVSIFFLQNKKK